MQHLEHLLQALESSSGTERILSVMTLRRPFFSGDPGDHTRILTLGLRVMQGTQTDAHLGRTPGSGGLILQDRPRASTFLVSVSGQLQESGRCAVGQALCVRSPTPWHS